MQENLSELAKKYQEEMLRLYRNRQPGTELIREDSPAPEPELPEPEASEPEPSEPELPESESPEPEPSLPPDFPEAHEPIDPEIYGEPELPQYIQPITPTLPAEWQAQEDYEAHHTAQGYLRVIAAAAESAYPIPDARVSVFTNIGGKAHLNYLMVTKENGETPTVTLPAPPADLSQVPESEAPYASCDIRIAAKGFFRTQANDVHIFAGVTTRQVFQLVPLPLGGELPGDDIDPNAIGRTEDCQGGAVC